MGLLSRRNGEPVNGLLRRVGLGLASLQLKIAVWLNAKTRRYSSRKWLLLLVIFCLLVGTSCLYLIISSIY